MCGIVGYAGSQRKIVDVLMEGLKRLEYRGYDSAGIAVVKDGVLSIRRSKGKLRNLEEQLRGNHLEGDYGLGHTRWATHGRPTEENAHPHRDCEGKIVVVHNGIIENYLELRHRLSEEGHKLVTETDTEVIAHLIEKHFDGDLTAAARAAAGEMEGVYVFCAIHTEVPGTLVGFRNGPPLIIGYSENEAFLASDIPAVLSYTRDVYPLNDGEFATLTESEVKVTNLAGEPVTPKVERINWDPIMVEKGGFKHFMLKEIHEQPSAIRETLEGRLFLEPPTVDLTPLLAGEQDIRDIKKVVLVACGTSWHAALVGKFYIEELAGIPAEVDYGSEFRYRSTIVDSEVLTIAISQSGETADTLAAMRESSSKGSPIFTICNVQGSMATREAQGVMYTHAGPEIGVASTKAFTSQLAALYLLALRMGELKGALEPEKLLSCVKAMNRIPHLMENVLRHEKKIEALARQYYRYSDFLYLGRGANYPIALEGALKLKEISYIHAEGYPAGEMKHGPIALIDENFPTVAIALRDRVYEKMLGNIEEVKARNGRVIAIVTEGDNEISQRADDTIAIPECDPLLSPLLVALPLQLFAYHVAVRLGCDVDQPRNLAKSVTVE